MPKMEVERRKVGEFVCKKCARYCPPWILVSPPELIRIMDRINMDGGKSYHWNRIFSLDREHFSPELFESDVPKSLMFAIKTRGEPPSLFGGLEKDIADETCLFLKENKECELHGLKEHGIGVKPDGCRLFPFFMAGDKETLEVKGPEGPTKIKVEKKLVINPLSACPGVRARDKERVLSVEEDKLRKRLAYDDWVSEQAHKKVNDLIEEERVSLKKAVDKTLDWIRKWYQKGKL